MSTAFFRRFIYLFLFIFNVPFLFLLAPLHASSSLAAWQLTKNGELKFRTARNSKPLPFYEPATSSKGDRIWIDFSGEPQRIRSFKGNGPIKEIRIGKPKEGITRFVVEFIPSVTLDPSILLLRGVSPDNWLLTLKGISIVNLNNIGEGTLSSLSYSNRAPIKRLTNIQLSNYRNSLPQLNINNYTVVIDPGHGGPDPGAVGINGIKESKIVLDVSLKVANLLKSRGINVILTRNNEIDVDLPPRALIANRKRADAFISIHANATINRRRDVNGIETYYFYSSEGKRLSENIHREVVKVSPGSPDRGVRKGRFFVIRRTNMPASLVEIGFVTGRIDSARLSTSEHRSNVSYAIARGIILFLKELT